MLKTGIEQLVAAPPAWLKGKRLGLLCNQASTDREFRHSRDLVAAVLPGHLTCLFSPQHGFFADKQDNMIESAHMHDRATGLPIFSLYGESRQPDEFMMDHLDVLLVDLQDVGTRVYTFIHTMAYCLKAAAACGKKVVILDRPNPLGGALIEGNLVEEGCRSFVGLYPIPMRHGLTMGELAQLFNEHFGINADLEIIAMSGWHRAMTFDDAGLPWVFPSPNMPAPATALVYPGQVIWEGTNVSEGRGTCLPFELFGAPWLDHQDFVNGVDRSDLAGAVLRPVAFEPTSNKHCGRLCNGFQLQVTERRAFRPYRASLSLLRTFLALYPEHFAYKEPPYEYEYEKLPLDMILGSRLLREALEAGEKVGELEKGWREELAGFDRLRRKFFLYS
ncbi:MAG: DUF1343 domain-containing protein [Desulfurivibrionaceae bacterium]|nr:DUF1343 domain-containing protein [Desulfurivibrionaceae bacterium]